MNIQYMYAESSVPPQPIEVTNTTVYLRKDFSTREYIEPDRYDVVTFYTYQEAKLTHSEFAEYSSQIASLNAVKGINDSENISKIVQNGVDNEDNQLILMEAMADLYDLLANLM